FGWGWDDRVGGQGLPATRLVRRGLARVLGGGGRYVRRCGGLCLVLITHGCSAPGLALASPLRPPGRGRWIHLPHCRPSAGPAAVRGWWAGGTRRSGPRT